MPEYIEREAAFKTVEDYARSRPVMNDAELFALLCSVPVADVRPVVRGHWYWDEDGMDWGIGAWRCSACKGMSPMWWNCDKKSPNHRSGHNYCPICGADMREGEE